MINSDHSQLGVTLIDKATENCYSRSDLARRIGTSAQALQQMRDGTRPISPETAALLADVAKVDARQAVIDAVIERQKKDAKGVRIREILGKALVAGAGAVLLLSYSVPSINATAADLERANPLTTLYIVSSRIMRKLANWLLLLHNPRHGYL